MSEGGHRHISWLLLPGDSPLETADVSVPVAVSNTRLPDSPTAHTSLLGMCGGTVLRLQTVKHRRQPELLYLRWTLPSSSTRHLFLPGLAATSHPWSPEIRIRSADDP